MSTSSWSDLRTRVISGVLLAVIGIGSLVLGGVWFQALIAVFAGLMVWELVKILSQTADQDALTLGVLTSVSVVVSVILPGVMGLFVLILPAAAGAVLLKESKVVYVVFAAAIMLGTFGILQLRVVGLSWVLWLALVVVATDTAGYFAGRHFGGPKFWPAVSPNKTWSGTAGGWVAAAVVGAIMAGPTGAGLILIPASILLSMGSQAGDLSESALKRKFDVKDSSNLIPGHGGLLDRFDGMLGAAVLVTVAALIGLGPLAAAII